MACEPLDFGYGSARILRVGADGAEKSPPALGSVEPALHQPIVDRSADPAVQQVVRDVAARERVENGEVDPGLGEQLAGNGFGHGPGILAVVEVGPVVPTRSLIPLLFDVGNG